MRIAFALIVLAPITAFADEATRPEELFLGDHAWLQDRAELQLSARPAWQRERWDMGAAVEYGATSRIQLQLEGTWSDGANMEVLRAFELGATYGLLRGRHWAVAVGGNATGENTGSELELGFEPQASASFGTPMFGANLAVSTPVTGEIHPSVAVALFARFGAVYPIVEAGMQDRELVARGGLALQLGAFEVAAAVGYGEDAGTSVHAALTWEIELGDDDHDGGDGAGEKEAP